MSKGGRLREKTGELGQSVVELALVLPVLLIILFGIVNVGDSYNAYLTVVEAGRDGARLGSKGLATDAQIKAAIALDMGRLNGFDANRDIVITHNPMADPSLKVQVCHNHNLILPFYTNLGDPIRMCSSTTMRSLTYN